MINDITPIAMKPECTEIYYKAVDTREILWELANAKLHWS